MMDLGGSRVKVVLPCTNEGEWLRATVESLLTHTDWPALQVHVLANGDETTDFSFVEEPGFRKRVRVTEFRERLGVGNSINRAVLPGDADYYFFLDAHCLVEQRDWLERLISCMAEHSEASMVQPAVTEFIYQGELKPGDSVDPSLIEERMSAYSVTWAWPYEKPSELAEVNTVPWSEEPYEAMAGGGMAVFVRANTFHSLGKYDPEVSGWYPETMDYCVRAWLLGHPMIVDPTVKVLHRIKTEAASYPRTMVDLIHGVLRTAYKYLSPRRRDLAELLFRRHGYEQEVEEALDRVARGQWLKERACHERERIHDDDWLFRRFQVYEERAGIHVR